LIELATHRPDSARAMREIHGVGDTKLDRYGAAFLEIIQSSAR
jgi:ATP-dependent DNA helicase RecQ